MAPLLPGFGRRTTSGLRPLPSPETILHITNGALICFLLDFRPQSDHTTDRLDRYHQGRRCQPNAAETSGKEGEQLLLLSNRPSTIPGTVSVRELPAGR